MGHVVVQGGRARLGLGTHGVGLGFVARGLGLSEPRSGDEEE